MSLAKRFYDILVAVLQDTHDLEASASLLRTDRTIARKFGVSESTVKNWRRGRHSQVAPSTATSIIAQCEDIAPHHVADLKFIDRLSRGTHEVKLAAELLVDQLSEHVLDCNSTWHIYSGPLKIAFDPNFDSNHRLQLMNRSSMIVERVLEMQVDQADIPCIAELIRYSTHCWYLNGLFKIREASLSSQIAGIQDGYLSTIEAALYLGDGCAVPCLLSGNPERARRYTDQALALIEQADVSESSAAGVDLHDARIMIRAIQAIIAAHWAYQHQPEPLDQLLADLEHTRAENDWIEGTRHEALGGIELVRRVDYHKAAQHFEQAGSNLDRWLAQFGIPFSSTSSQSLRGYALMMTQGPTEDVRLQISEGLIRTIDLGIVYHQIRARLCQSLFYDRRADRNMARFHRDKAVSLVKQHDLYKCYEMLNHILLPVESACWS